ncbi:MAG: GtrA family protein [Tannerellaceae bacterium]|nr:GtrA family protein [Tannerellaceae bacterium]
MEIVKQAIKYGVVGAINTAITAGVIWVCMKCFGVNEEISNALGFIAGVVNSFIWNKRWTFQSSHSWAKDGARFLIAFAICYPLQLGVFMYLKTIFTTIDPYYLQLVGMGVYTVANFLLNKFYTFK